MEVGGQEFCTGGNHCVVQGQVGGGVSTSSLSIRVIEPKSLLLFPNKLLQHKASLCDESVGTKRQNLIVFHLSLPLILSLHLSASVFPRRNNWHSSPSRGKKLIYILPRKHTLTQGLSTQTLKTAEESSPSSSFPDKLPFALAVSSCGGKKKPWTFLSITLLPKCILGSVPAGRGSWRSLIAQHGSPFVLHAHCCRKRPPRRVCLKETFYRRRAKCLLFLDSYYFYTLKNTKLY